LDHAARMKMLCLAVLPCAGCGVIADERRASLASYDVGRVFLERYVATITSERAEADTVRVVLDHASEDKGDCPGLSTDGLDATLSGVRAEATIEPGGRQVFVDRTICSSAVLGFRSGASPIEHGHLVLADDSARIEVDVDGLLAPLAVSPSPRELTSITAGQVLVLHVPGSSGAALDIAAADVKLRALPDTSQSWAPVPHPVPGGLAMNIPAELTPGGMYRLEVVLPVTLDVARCVGVDACEVAPTLLRADYQLSVGF